MAKLKDLEVTIVVMDKTLPEYEDNGEKQPANTVTKYVEAVPGARFEIVISCKKKSLVYGPTGLKLTRELDGENASKGLMYKEKGICVQGTSNSGNDQSTLERFRFSNIEIIEDEPDPENKDLEEVMSKIGVITVKVYRVKNIRRQKARSSCTRTGGGPGLITQPIPEKLLKGESLSMFASFEAPEQIDPFPRYYGDSIDPDYSPYAIFRFKYRSHNALQDLCIIPRSPIPVFVGERPIEELTREELIEFIQSRHVTVKPEPIPQINSSAGVKRERDEEYEEILASTKSKKLRVNQEIEVIDLLDD